MANSNVNIASKLYAYIKHGVDIDNNIKQIYNSSMIFIGDEQQIYVPVMDTYVGIGMTAYNNTLDRITKLEASFNDVTNKLSQNLISTIYANYSWRDLSYNSYINAEDKNDNSFLANDSAVWEFHNEVTFRGVNDYDPTTGFARTIENPYVIEDAEGNQYRLDDDETAVAPGLYNASSLYRASEGKSLPTSGIKVTPHWGEQAYVWNPLTQQQMLQRVGNYIEIDDSLTWSYMTSAYAYALNYSTNYVNSEVERIYHNLLGDSEGSYTMVSFGSAVEDIAFMYNKLTPAEQAQYNANNPNTWVVTGTEIEDSQNPGVGTGTYEHVYKIKKDVQYFYFAYTSNALTDSELEGTAVYYPISYQTIADMLDSDNSNNPELLSDMNAALSASYTGIIRYLSESEVPYLPIGNSIPQLYVYDEQYNSSYNMNIKDGIETLKEVAYLLDLLTDAQLGSVTYYTYAQVTAAPAVEGEDNEFEAAMHTSGNNTYWINTDPNWNPNPTDTYAYIVNTGNPENLGIQIAYSIAGNQVQIDDLHAHTDLLEEGKTTLRSIQSTNTNFVNIDLIGGTTHWTNTDSNQGEANFGDESSHSHPNYQTEGKTSENSYLVGDVNIKVSLNTATTYTTSYTAPGEDPKNIKYIDNYNVLWFGSYTQADMENLPNNYVAGTYYVIGNDGLFDENNAQTNSINNARYAVFTPVTSEDYDIDKLGGRYQETGTQYYWKPNGDTNNSFNNEHQNVKYKSFNVSKYLELGPNETLVPGIIKDGKYDIYVKASDGNYYVYSTTASNDNGASTEAFVSSFNNGNGNRMAELNQTFSLNEDELTEDSVIYIIDPSQIKEVVVHAVIGEDANKIDNALATTEWVDVFVEAKVDELKTDLEDILERAKEYTREQIGKLDLNYKYSDFNSYWNTYLSTLSAGDPILVVGSSEYNTAYEDVKQHYETFTTAYSYSVFVDPNATGQDKQYRLSYQLNSQYTYNTVEENGIVRPETRELPTDTLSAKYRVWGDEQNGAADAHVYSDVVLAGENGEDTDKDFNELYVENEGLFMRLYKWFSAYTSGNGTDTFKDDSFENQLFVADGLTYQLVPYNAVVTSNFVDLANDHENDHIDNTLVFSEDGLANLYYLSDPEANEYSPLGDYTATWVENSEKVHGNAVTAFDYANSNDKYWKQLYVRVPKYVEIDLQKAEDTGNTSSNERNDVRIRINDTDFYLLTATTPGEEDTTITVTKYVNNAAVSGFSETLKYIETRADAKKQYLTVENKHFSYVDNGYGENQFEITAHITNIEDASETNTGFADAFDVQTYVKNFFSWVDVSATVTDDIVNTSDKYYKVITWAEYDAMETKPALYKRSVDGSNNIEYGDGTTRGNAAVASNGTPSTSWYWADDDKWISSVDTDAHFNYATGKYDGADLTPEISGNHIMIDGHWFHKEFNATNISTEAGKYDRISSNYYIRIEEPKINPLNRAETQYK